MWLAPVAVVYRRADERPELEHLGRHGTEPVF
jgi:hypothetical protein